jgi:hypothetical protein
MPLSARVAAAVAVAALSAAVASAVVHIPAGDAAAARLGLSHGSLVPPSSSSLPPPPSVARLLVCVAAHFSPHRLPYLDAVLRRFLLTYPAPVHVALHTNNASALAVHIDGLVDLAPAVSARAVSVHAVSGLAHPYLLTWAHRRTVADAAAAGAYDVFMYVEDDIDVPYAAYVRHLENLDLLWPSASPAFLRSEVGSASGQEDGGVIVNPDNLNTTTRLTTSLVKVGGRLFARPANAYWAGWVLRADAVREVIAAADARKPGIPHFFEPVNGLYVRPHAALLAQHGAGRVGVVELTADASGTHPAGVVRHLPNTYVVQGEWLGTPGYGRLPLNDVLRIVDPRERSTEGRLAELHEWGLRGVVVAPGG